MEIARARADREVFGRYGFKIVVEDVRLCRNDGFQSARLAQEIGRQNLDGGSGIAGADGPDNVGEMLRTAVGEIVAVDRSDDDMFEAKFFDGLCNVFGLMGVERGRQTGAHIAEGAGAGADFAHDHHRGVLLAPALADVGTARFLANGDEIVLAHDLLGFAVNGRTGRLDPDPVGLAQHLGVGTLRLFRVSWRFGAYGIEKSDHCVLFRTRQADVSNTLTKVTTNTAPAAATLSWRMSQFAIGTSMPK